MNLFEVIMLDAILILFPLIVYNLFLSTNKNISNMCKKLFFSFTLFTSLFITYKYSQDNTMINLLVMSSLVLIGYLKHKYITANTVALTIILLYYHVYNYLLFMLIPYVILIFINILKQKKHISDFVFIDLFILTEYICFFIWVKLFNPIIIASFSTLEMIMAMSFNYLIIHIIYLLYDEGDHIINYHMDYKELAHEKQVRLSLFKITHEIKNPIAVVKAYLDMLNMNDQKQVRKYIPIIRNEIDRLLALLEDFMLMNKGKMDLDIMDINMLLEDVVRLVNPVLQEKNINLKQEMIDDEIFIEGDYKRLSQVFINLLKNSIEAIDTDSGKIRIKNSIIDNKINIIIEDNGIGISSKNLAKIKTPFYTTKKRGTGLGVSLSNEIIEAHQGKLTYDSQEGSGTKVIIELPLNREERYT